MELILKTPESWIFHKKTIVSKEFYRFSVLPKLDSPPIANYENHPQANQDFTCCSPSQNCNRLDEALAGELSILGQRGQLSNQVQK
jgi:hypothetical protein